MIMFRTGVLNLFKQGPAQSHSDIGGPSHNLKKTVNNSDFSTIRRGVKDREKEGSRKV